MPCILKVEGFFCAVEKQRGGRRAQKVWCSPLPTPEPAWMLRQVSRVFEPFFTTKGFGGTGLGLWVSQEIVERHQGHIQVRSTRAEGRRGTVFTLFLPFETPIRQTE